MIISLDRSKYPFEHLPSPPFPIKILWSEKESGEKKNYLSTTSWSTLSKSLSSKNSLHQFCFITNLYERKYTNTSKISSLLFIPPNTIQYIKKNRRKIGKLLSSGSTFPSEETPPRTKSERSERSATGGGQRLRFPRWIRHVNGAELYTHTLPVGNRYTATDNRQSRGEAKVAKKRLTRPDFRNPRSAWPA